VTPPFSLVTQDRLVIREGGGCLSLFGLPFVAAGLLLLLAALGLVPGDIATDPRPWARPGLLFMGLVFSAVGGTLVFGRQWTTVDRTARVVLKQQGLVMPMRESRAPLDHYATVSLSVVEGDSDSSDRFPVTLKDRATGALTLCSFTDYGKARACATAVAQHLSLPLDDASSSHVVQLTGAELSMSLRERVRREGVPRREDLTSPPDTRIVVSRDADRTTLVIPNRPSNPLTLVGAAIPIALLFTFGRTLLPFFRQTHTPDGIIWVFGGFFTLAFGLPTLSALNAFIRSRRGATIVQASRDSLRVDQRGAWMTTTVAAVEGRDILDLDYTTTSSRVAAARTLAAQRTLQTHPSPQPVVSPRVERVISLLARFASGKGIVVKTRDRIVSFAQGLDDDETKYVYGVVRRALVE